MIFEKIDIFVFQVRIKIKNCQIFVLIKIRVREDHVITHFIYITKFIIISFRSKVYILMHYVILFDHDFFFEFDKFQLFLYAHFVNAFMIIVFIKNNLNQIIKIFEIYVSTLFKKQILIIIIILLLNKKTSPSLLFIILKKYINKIKSNEFSIKSSSFSLSLY